MTLKSPTFPVDKLTLKQIVHEVSVKLSGITTNAAVTETQGGTGQTTITQGDLLYGSAANTLSKLAAGTDGYFLKTQGAGANPIWAAADGDGFPNSGYRTNYYYYGAFSSQTSTFTPAVDTIYCFPFMVGVSATFTRIGINVTSAEAAKSARLGIYQVVNGVPTTLVVDAGTVSLATTGEKEITISQSLSPSTIYALCYVVDSTTAVITGRANNASITQHISGSSAPTTSVTGWTKAHAFAALPSPFGTPVDSATSNQGIVWLRVV